MCDVKYCSISMICTDKFSSTRGLHVQICEAHLSPPFDQWNTFTAAMPLWSSTRSNSSFIFHHYHQSLVPTTFGSATWVLFLHSNLCWVKSTYKLHFFVSMFISSIYVFFGLFLHFLSLQFIPHVVTNLSWNNFLVDIKDESVLSHDTQT